MRWSAVAFTLVLLAPLEANAFKRELGFSIEPMFLALPSVHPSSNGALSIAPGGAFALEYYPLNYLSIVIRAGYAFAVMDSQIGNASFENRDGVYWLRQSAGIATAGLRIETPQYWIPVTFSLTAQGGVAVIVHQERELRNDAGIAYSNVVLTPLVQAAPCFTASLGVSYRAGDQVRIGIEPTLNLVFAGRVFIGFGLAASLAFFFFV